MSNLWSVAWRASLRSSSAIAHHTGGSGSLAPLAVARQQIASVACPIATLLQRGIATEERRSGFVDKIRVQVIGGSGGKGVVSFENVTNWKKRPMGGTGGRGGDIIIEASASVQDLNFQTYVIRGRNGWDASGAKGSSGRDGRAKRIIVPVGTIVREVQRMYVVNEGDVEDEYGSDGGDDEIEADDVLPVKRGKDTIGVHAAADAMPGLVTVTPHAPIDKLRARRASGIDVAAAEPDEEAAAGRRVGGSIRVNKRGMAFRETASLLTDLDTPGQRVLVARGGQPGTGNRGSTLTYSEQKQEELKPHITGGRGEIRFLELELKSIADVGLVGFPNAGKSSFLAAVSKARPRIAEYPFTTLHPHVGTVAFKDSESITVADIPGLIEGAHEDRGLGHEFLRHIERTRVLAYVIDTSAANADPVGDLASLQSELRLYDPVLPLRPSIVIANKGDLPGAAAGAAKLRASTPLPVLEVSAMQRQGVGAVVEAMRWLIDAARPKGASI